MLLCVGLGYRRMLTICTAALGEHDRLAVGGRAIGVGVGGLSLIGGTSVTISFLFVII